MTVLSIPTCDCGREAVGTCWDVTGRQPLVPCNKLVCKSCCPAHRHEPGTMGYVGWRGATQYLGDVPDGPGAWQRLKSLWRSVFWTPQQKAQHVWTEMVENFPPPSPLPYLQLTVEGRRFEPRGLAMVEVDSWTEELHR